MTTLPMKNGRIDWTVYHAQRAAEFRDVAMNWRTTARDLAEGDPQFAVFAMVRANANDMFAKDSEAQAKELSAV